MCNDVLGEWCLHPVYICRNRHTTNLQVQDWQWYSCPPSPLFCLPLVTEVLQVLMVDANQIGNLPARLNLLTKLETLTCSHNLMLSLPATIGSLRNLRMLDCSSNKIVALPQDLGDAAALEEINASDNYLQAGSVPSVVIFYSCHTIAWWEAASEQ